MIQHRFGTLNSGFYNLWGLDNSQVRMGLDYGLSERINLSLGRSSTNKQFDGSVKANILPQTESCPIVLSFFQQYFLRTHQKV